MAIHVSHLFSIFPTFCFCFTSSSRYHHMPINIQYLSYICQFHSLPSFAKRHHFTWPKMTIIFAGESVIYCVLFLADPCPILDTWATDWSPDPGLGQVFKAHWNVALLVSIKASKLYFPNICTLHHGSTNS